MGMADRNDGMTAIEIEIFGSFFIPNIRSKTFYRANIIERINIE
jgi:hypothetical protein